MRADKRADRVYDALRADFGESSPRASGYLSERAFLRERALVLQTLGGAPGTVVDLACGAGLMTLPLVRAGRRVIGVDFNAAACRQAARNGLRAVRGDAFALPLADHAADVVLNVEFAQQYPLPAVGRMLREAARVLRPGGRLVLVWANRAALVHRVVSAGLRVFAGRGRRTVPLVNHAPPAMRAGAQRAGLALDEMFAIFPPLRLRFRRSGGPWVRLLGSSHVAVFRKRG